MKPFVSVIMPVYNGERFLRDAIESILHQTFTDFEFLIIDDGSVDNTVAIIESYTDQRIKFIRNANNMGITATLNKGINQACGNYICRMDADDIALPERIGVQVKYLEENRDVALVGSFAIVINGAGEKKYTEEYPRSYDKIKRSIFIHNPFAHSSVMIRHSVLDELGVYDPGFLHNEDYDLWLRIAAKYPVANLENVLLLRRVHDKNITVEKELELTRYRIRTLYHALRMYYSDDQLRYFIFLLRPVAAYWWRVILKLFSGK